MLAQMDVRCLFCWLALAFCFAACREETAEALPPQYQQKGDFIKSLPYFNPDSCVLLVRRDVPPRWQGAAYENLFLDGPEDSPLELGFKHLNFYEKNFPADTAREFAQLWRGRLYTYLGKLDSARQSLQESYESSNRHGRFLRAADAQEAIASQYLLTGHVGEAIRAYLRVFDVVQQLDSTQNDRKYTNIANIAAAYFSSNNPREALRWIHRALPLVESQKHPILPESKVDFFRRSSVIYGNLEMPDSALLFAKQALDFHDKNKTINDRTQLLESLSDAYRQKGDCSTAKKYILEAIRSLRGDNPQRLSDLANTLADAYFCLGQRDSAEMLYRNALALDITPTSQNYFRKQLSKIHASKGSYKPAYELLDSVLLIQKQMYSPQKVQEVGAIRAELELELEKQKALETRQEVELSRQQNLITALSLLLALGFLVSLYLRQRGRRRILEQENQILEKDKTLLAQEKELVEAREILKTQELERSQQDLKKSEHSLKMTQDELEATARLLNLKNRLVEELEMRLLEHQTSSDDDGNIPSSAIAAEPLFRMKILTENDWHHFREAFEQAFPGFQVRLKSRFSELTAAETRLFLLCKLKFTAKETSEALGISLESVYRSRNRLSKKLGLSETGDLDEFIRQFA